MYLKISLWFFFSLLFDTMMKEPARVGRKKNAHTFSWWAAECMLNRVYNITIIGLNPGFRTEWHGRRHKSSKKKQHGLQMRSQMQAHIHALMITKTLGCDGVEDSVFGRIWYFFSFFFYSIIFSSYFYFYFFFVEITGSIDNRKLCRNTHWDNTFEV